MSILTCNISLYDNCVSSQNYPVDVRNAELKARNAESKEGPNAELNAAKSAEFRSALINTNSLTERKSSEKVWNDVGIGTLRSWLFLISKSQHIRG